MMSEESVYCNVPSLTTQTLRKNTRTRDDSGSSRSGALSTLDGSTSTSAVSKVTRSEVSNKPKPFVIVVMLLLSISVVLLVVALSTMLLYTLPMLTNMQQEYDHLLAQLEATQTNNSVLIQEKNNLGLKIYNLTKEIRDLQNQLSGIHPGCPMGWNIYDGKCYNFSTGTTQNWENSRDACVTLGGHLVIINSEEEKTFLMKTQRNASWIGLRGEPEAWRWVDNTPLDSSLGTPEAPTDTESCAYMEEEMWKLVDCGNTTISYHWICETLAGTCLKN